MTNLAAKKPLIAAGLSVLLIIGLSWAGLRWYGQLDAEEAETAALAEQNALNTQLMQEQLGEQLTSTLLDAQQERIDSPTGQALMRQCLEWTEFNDNHPSDSSLANREQACNAYNNYVKTGVAPRNND